MRVLRDDGVSATKSSSISFRSLSVGDLSSLLPRFYLSMGFDARRARFGCAVSDDSITRHCLRLDLERSVILGCIGDIGLLAAIELHPLSSTWEDVELAVTEDLTTDKVMILGHLLQLAAFVAGKRGCIAFIASLNPSEYDLLRLLRSMGRVRVQGESARVDISEYAIPRNFESVR